MKRDDMEENRVKIVCRATVCKHNSARCGDDEYGVCQQKCIFMNVKRDDEFDCVNFDWDLDKPVHKPLTEREKKRANTEESHHFCGDCKYSNKTVGEEPCRHCDTHRNLWEAKEDADI